MVILSITPWLPTYIGQSLIRCNITAHLSAHFGMNPLQSQSLDMSIDSV